MEFTHDNHSHVTTLGITKTHIYINNNQTTQRTSKKEQTETQNTSEELILEQQFKD